MKEEKATHETNKLKENNQWKELAEAKEKEANDAKAETARIKDSFVGNQKYNAARDKCKALGLRPEAEADLESLDLEAITIETTSTGKINVLGADKFAERLKTVKPSSPKMQLVFLPLEIGCQRHPLTLSEY